MQFEDDNSSQGDAKPMASFVPSTLQAAPPPPLVTLRERSGSSQLGIVVAVAHAAAKARKASMARQTPKKVRLPIHKTHVEGDTGGIEMKQAARSLLIAVDARPKYKSIDKGQNEPCARLIPPITLRVDEGIINYSGEVSTPISWEAFFDDVTHLLTVAQHPHARACCKYRLQVLEEKYNLYRLNNASVEANADKCRKGGGIFANATKIDTCIRMDSCMNAPDLLDHIKHTYAMEGDDPVKVVVGDRKEALSLRKMFEQIDVEDPNLLSVEGLGLFHQRANKFHRFETTELHLQKSGNTSLILSLFLSRHETTNNGKYFADAVRPVLARSEGKSQHLQATEMLLEFTGLSETEWEELAMWIRYHQLDCQTNRWIVVIPRDSNRDKTLFEFYQKHFDNIFLPLFQATLAPEDPKNAEVAWLLTCIGGFTIISDEEVRESEFSRRRRVPAEVSWMENMSDMWYSYYLWANLCSLNALRKRKGLNTFQFRTVAGEHVTHKDSLVYAYLLCDSISHGLALEEDAVMQFLFGLYGIGIHMSPLANNTDGTEYTTNPFPTFFKRGLAVTLATDSPLHNHFSRDPLIEEYSTAAKLYHLSPVDMSEISRMSVIQSSFADEVKMRWLGPQFRDGSLGNMMEMSNVPTPRLEFRESVWECERLIISEAAKDAPAPELDLTLRNQSILAIDKNVENFPRIIFVGPLERDTQHITIATDLEAALKLRRACVWEREGTAWSTRARIEHAFKPQDTFVESAYDYKMVHGVICLHEVHKVPRVPEHIALFSDFRSHLSELKAITDKPEVKEFAKARLALLEEKFKLHLSVNHSKEAGTTQDKSSQNRDFYQATKVDTNVHMETGMTARQLLDFIVSKANNNGDDIVSHEKGKEPQTLRQLFRELMIEPNHLTVDNLNVQVDTALGVASQQFTPEGRDTLLTLLLKTDNQMRGRYFAELTKLTFENFMRDRFTFAENRLPIYGAARDEWKKLSTWFDTHGMACYNNQWMIQIPRIYSHLRNQGKVENFADYLWNIFEPLWEVSLHPSKNPRLFHFLNYISGFDCVEDERKGDAPLNAMTPTPQDWTSTEDPPYNYYLYYIWSNLFTLNDLRRQRNFSTFKFRPSCGEDGPIDHLLGGFLLANGINYGLRLMDDPVLQYLFYLAQIGVAVSPLSNNTKVLGYLDNPFPVFFRRGLNVSLSTDGPLQFHHTQEPLIEEYSIASKVWKLSPNDMCEIARNSVKQSGFDHSFKKERLGEFYFLSSSKNNDEQLTHLSSIRVAYRYETYHSEIKLLEYYAGSNNYPKALMTQSEEDEMLANMKKFEQKNALQSEIGNIIGESHDKADLEKLVLARQSLHTALLQMKKSLEHISKQNRKLNELLSDEMIKDTEAQVLRRNKDTFESEPTLTLNETSSYGEVGTKLSAANELFEMIDENGEKIFAHLVGTNPEDEDDEEEVKEEEESSSQSQPERPLVAKAPPALTSVKHEVPSSFVFPREPSPSSTRLPPGADYKRKSEAIGLDDTAVWSSRDRLTSLQSHNSSDGSGSPLLGPGERHLHRRSNPTAANALVEETANELVSLTSNLVRGAVAGSRMSAVQRVDSTPLRPAPKVPPRRSPGLGLSGRR